MSRRTQSVNPTYPSGRKYMATNITARGNVMVYELPNAREKGDLVLYDGHQGTLWVEASRVGSSPEEAVKIALDRAKATVKGIKAALRRASMERDALVNVTKPSRPEKFVLKRPKVRA